MKQSLSAVQWHEAPRSVREQLEIWKLRKDYSEETLILGHTIEALVAFSNHLHQEDSDGRFWNNLLRNNESVIAWDGQELIDILWHELKDEILQRVAVAGTFTEAT